MVNFIETNPVTAGADRQRAVIDARRQKEQEQSLDAAIRGGIAEITAPQQPREEPVDPRTQTGQSAQPMPQRGPASDTGAVQAPAPQSTETRPGGAGGQSAAVIVTPSTDAPYSPAPPQGRQDPLIGRLAATPGGGAMAMQRYDQLQGDKDAAEREAIKALANDDLTTFNHYASIAGLNVPQQVLNDANKRRLFGAGMMVADQYYGDTSPRQALAFTQEFVASGGDYNRAFAAAGAPPQTMNSGKAPADQKMIQFLESRGIPFEQAVNLVTSAKGNDPRAAEQIWKVVYDGAPGTHEERQQIANQATEQFLGQFGSGAQQMGAGQQPAPAPAQQVPTHSYNQESLRIEPNQ